MITSGGFSIRYREYGSIHDVAGMSAYCNDKDILLRILGLMSTPVANKIFKILNPTINLQVGDFTNFPVLADVISKSAPDQWIQKNINLARKDWNTFETSWNFTGHPVLCNIAEHKHKYPPNSTLSSHKVPKMCQLFYLGGILHG